MNANSLAPDCSGQFLSRFARSCCALEPVLPVSLDAKQFVARNTYVEDELKAILRAVFDQIFERHDSDRPRTIKIGPGLPEPRGGIGAERVKLMRFNEARLRGQMAGTIICGPLNCTPTAGK